jgi:hypothetical protein
VLQLAVVVALAIALIGLLFLGQSGAPPIAPRELDRNAPPSEQPAPQTQAAVDSTTEHAAVRELASSPLLDLFEEPHRDAVSRVLALSRTAAVECIVLDVGRLEKWTGTGTLRLLCRETSEAKGVKKGDVIEAYHTPAHEMRVLHIDSGYEQLRCGEIRTFLLHRFLRKTFLRIPGRVTGTLDFDAMRNACDWPNGRDVIGNEGCSVLEGRMVPIEPSKHAEQCGCAESLLTIERVYWSAVGWEPAEVHRVKRTEGPELSPTDTDVEFEMRTAASPPEGVTLQVIVMHGWPFYDDVARARVR